MRQEHADMAVELAHLRQQLGEDLVVGPRRAAPTHGQGIAGAGGGNEKQDGSPLREMVQDCRPDDTVAWRA
jgi:hypothetical protein